MFRERKEIDSGGLEVPTLLSRNFLLCLSRGRLKLLSSFFFHVSSKVRMKGKWRCIFGCLFLFLICFCGFWRRAISGWFFFFLLNINDFWVMILSILNPFALVVAPDIFSPKISELFLISFVAMVW